MSFVNFVTLRGFAAEDGKYTVGQKKNFLTVKMYTETKAYKENEPPDRVEHWIKAFGENADNNRHVKAGDSVFVQGMIKEESYQDKASGAARKSRFISAFSMMSQEPHLADQIQTIAVPFGSDDDVPF